MPPPSCLARTLLAGLLLLSPLAVLAHGLSVSLQPVADGVRGQAIYTSGAPARDEYVMLLAGNREERLAEARCDDDGRFHFALPAAGRYRVVVEGEEGHRSEAEIDWLPPAGTAATADTAALTAVLRAELAPLREDIARLQARTRLAEIVGGIGILVGLLGSYAWWRARRAR
jgi:nickel transport protein